MKELFNAIALSTNPSMKINTEGYACPESEVRATKIWSIASDWQRLIIGGNSPKSIALSMIIHKLTVSKESINLLARSGAGITYTDVMRQSKTFAEDTKNDSNVAPNSIPKGQPTRVTIDNSDGRQQIITGLSTTHHTNSTIYAPRLVTNFDINYTHSENRAHTSMDETPNAVIENKENLSPLKLHLYRERHNYKDYKIGTRKEPPVLIKHVQVWAMTANLKSEDVPLPSLGSWTVFNSRIKAVKSDLDFLPYLQMIQF